MRFFFKVCALAVLLLVGGCSRTPEQKYDRFMKAGKKQAGKNDYHRAILDFHNAIQAQPKQAEAHYQLALAYLSTNRPKEAVGALRHATELDPNHSPAQTKLAELMIRTHDAELIQDAESRVQKILTGIPGDEDALFTLAATRAQTGRVEEAEKYLNQALNKSPGHLKSAIALAVVKVSQKDLAGAEQILKKAVEQSPSSADAAVALATLYAATGKLPESERQLLKAVQLDPKHADAWIGLGGVQVRAGKKAEAEEAYKRAAALPRLEHRLAYVAFLIQQNRRDDAIKELERMVKADRNDRIARSGLIAGYLATNRQAEAESILNDVLKRNSKDLEALLQRSQVYLRQHKYDAAQGDLDQILTMDSGSAQAHYLKSKVFRSKGDTLRQKQELFQTLSLAPQALTVRFDLADALLMANDPKAALQTLNAAPESQQRTLPYRLAHNWALIAVGDTNLARRGVDQALTVVKTPDLLLQDAVLRIAGRDFAGARAALEPLLKADLPDIRPLSLMVQTYVAQNQRQAATERLRQLAAQRPRAMPLQLFWAQWLLENNQNAEARQVLAAAKTSAPKNPSVLLSSAGLDFIEGKFIEARDTVTALLEIDQRNISALMLIAQVERATHNYTKAIGYYKKLLALDNRHLGALNNLAYALSRDPAKLDEALPLAQKAKELAPESPQVQDTLGWIYYRKKMYQMAARELEGALAKGERPVIQYHLGMTYNQLGNTTKGGRLMAAALAKEPKLADTEIIP